MRKESEVREELNKLRKGLETCEDWYKEVYAKHKTECLIHNGDTNDYEVRMAIRATAEYREKIALLQWVLADTKPEIPVTLNRDEGDE